ncbi:hypothetical protein BHE74_00025697 [Ensete ventricosum]|nr:hypothetical protein BHE74_00025697 [Ensete ventricosum]
MAASATASCSLRSHGEEAATTGWRWLPWQRRARFDSYDRGDYGDGGKAATRGPRLWLKKRVVAMAEGERERTTV